MKTTSSCEILKPSTSVNEAQKQTLANKITARLGDDLRGRTFALWGLAFKPNTDDMREAPSRLLIAALLDARRVVSAYDPVAMTKRVACSRSICRASPASSRASPREGPHGSAWTTPTRW